MKKRRGWLLTAAGLAAVMAAALMLAYQSRMLLPLWIRWESAHICGETAAEPDEILLRGRRATVCKGGAAVWQSERGIRVQDVLWCDIDHDGDKELMLLCWRKPPVLGRGGRKKLVAAYLYLRLDRGGHSPDLDGVGYRHGCRALAI